MLNTPKGLSILHFTSKLIAVFMVYQGLIDPRSGERACNSAYACRDGKMLVVTKIEPNAWAGSKGSCAVCVDLQAVGALEFFGEFYSLIS